MPNLGIANRRSGSTAVCAAAAFLLLWTASLSAQRKPGERFNVVGENTGALSTPWLGNFDIVINRWSSDAEKDQLLAELKKGGRQGLFDALLRMPRAGTFGVGGELKFAHRTTTPGGGEEIMLLANRNLSFQEVVNRPITFDYPFVVFSMQLDAAGTGRGTLSLATKITSDPDGRFIVMENYDTSPVKLRVRRDKS